MNVRTDNRIVFYGDPHGNWEPLIEAVALAPPAAVVILGDCELTRPLPAELDSVWPLVPAWRWIIGNHDVESLVEYESLVDGHPAGDLGGKVERLAGIGIAGLGGVFRARVWYPRPPDAAPAFPSRAGMVARTARADRFRGGVPRSSCATIFPEDVATLAQQRADILVCHEAPTSHPAGFTVIDELAAAMGVRLVVHGHHHCS